MPRARMIKPQFRRSQSMRRVSRDARLTFVQLWLVADDAGRAIAHPVGLPRFLYPGEPETWPLVAGWLAELEREHCIERYLVDGQDYLRVVNWRKHQKIYHPTPSRLPPRPVSRTPREALGKHGETASDDNDLDGISGIPERFTTLANRSGENAENPGPPASSPLFPSDS